MGISLAIAAAIVGPLIVFLLLRSKSAVIASQLAQKSQDLLRLQSELDAERKSSLAQRDDVAGLRATLVQERKASEEKLALIQQAETSLREAFKALSSDALRSNNESFLLLARSTLETYQTHAKGELEQREQAVAGMVDPIRLALGSVDQQIRDLEKARSEAYGTLKAQVDCLIDSQKNLENETGNLVKALRAPQVRGRWGEFQLRRVVEIAGMIPYCDFTEQASINTDEGRLRPDLILHLPGGKTVVVDSKTPLQAYLDALDTNDEEKRTALLGDHARQVRTHMSALGSKAYWNQFPAAPDFVVMFLPGETFFIAALQHDPGLIEYGVSQKVIPASPTTLIALLQAVAYGWKQEKIAENAQEISRLGKEIYDRLGTFAGSLRDLGGSLGRSVEQYNRAVASLESRVLVTGRRFSELGASLKEELPELPPVEKSVRELQAPEMVQHITIELPRKNGN